MIPAASGLDTGRAPASFVSIQASHFPQLATRPGSALRTLFLRRLRQSSRIASMENRRLGALGFKVPVLSLAPARSAARAFLRPGARRTSPRRAPRRHLPRRRLNMFDSADVYSGGDAEEVLGEAIKGQPRQGHHLDQGDLPQRRAAERRRLVALHLIRACEGRLRRLGTDYIDLFQLHGFDAHDAGRGNAERRSTTWCAPARSATSAARISRAGI